MINSNKQTARLAGLLYLVIAITGGFGHFSLHGGIIVPGNATETVNHIRASEMLFRMGFLSNLLCQLCFIILPLVLYKLLSPVNKPQALLMVAIVLAGVPLACMNMLNQFAALVVLNGNSYLNAFDTEQINALVMLFLNLQKYGVLIAQLFWGLWLLPLGYLVIKSGFLPKVVGWLLIGACFAYVIGSFTEFLVPHHSALLELIYIEPSIAEISVCLYLLIKGVKTKVTVPVAYQH